jgi:hypothetical protein
MSDGTALPNDEVFALLRDAQALYDRYVELARLGAAAAMAELGANEFGSAELGSAEVGLTGLECGPSHRDLSHPLGLVIDTRG